MAFYNLRQQRTFAPRWPLDLAGGAYGYSGLSGGAVSVASLGILADVTCLWCVTTGSIQESMRHLQTQTEIQTARWRCPLSYLCAVSHDLTRVSMFPASPTNAFLFKLNWPCICKLPPFQFPSMMTVASSHPVCFKPESIFLHFSSTSWKLGAKIQSVLSTSKIRLLVLTKILILWLISKIYVFIFSHYFSFLRD